MSTVSDSASGATAPGEQLPQRDGWEVKKVKHLFTSLDGKRVPLSAEERTNRQGEYPYYGASGIIDRVNSYIFDEDLLLVAEDGANLLNRASPVAFVASGKYWVNNHAHILKPVDGLLRFWAYRLEAVDLTPFVTGSAQPKLTSEALFNISIVVPNSIDDRSCICAFLDRETAQIDALIAKQEQLIAVLQEKRQALISHAVTKGLNPDAPMKDSGVEWLGEVPAHWSAIPLRRLLTTIEQGQTLDSENRSAEIDEWGVLKSGCVNGGKFRVDEHKALAVGTQFDLHNEVKPGDILMSRASGSIELVGSVALVGDVRRGLLLSDKTFRLVPSSDILPEFLVAQLNARHVRTQIELLANGAEGLPNNITKPSINSLFVALPPLEEQRAIIEYLAGGVAELDCVGVQAGKMVSALQERRGALISAAVTGKIDVLNQVNQSYGGNQSQDDHPI